MSLARLLEAEELKKNKGVSATRRTKLPSGITAHNGNMSYDSGTIGSPMRLGSASTPQVSSNSNVKLMMMMMTFLIAGYMIIIIIIITLFICKHVRCTQVTSLTIRTNYEENIVIIKNINKNKNINNKEYIVIQCQ